MFRVISITVVRFLRNIERKEDERVSSLYFDLYYIDRLVRLSRVRRQGDFYNSLKRRRIEMNTYT